MKMGRFLVHVDYRRDDIFPTHTVNEEIACSLEKGLYCLWGFSLKELRACGNQRINKFGAVLSCSAPGFFDTLLDEVIISALRLDDVEVVFASACVNVGIAGIFFFLSFVMALQRSCRSALVFFKS